MFKWFWTIFSLGAPGTCSITGGEFKSSTQTTLSCLTVFLVWVFPVLFACVIEIPVFYLVYTRLCWVFPFSFPASFIMQLLCNYSLFSDLLFARLAGCIHFGIWCCVNITCISHIVAFFFFRSPFDFLSVIVYFINLVSLPFYSRVFI